MNTAQQPLPVVVGVDGSPSSRAALAWAARWAGHFGHPVRLLTAQQLRASSPLIEDQIRQDIKTKLREQAQALETDHERLNVTADVVWLNPAEALVEASRDAVAVVVGNRGVGGWHGLTLGSVSVAVSSHAHSPVIVVPEGTDPVSLHSEVVLGVDGSPESHEAAEFAFEQAARLSCRLRAVHVRTPGQILGVSVDALSDRGPLPSQDESRLMATALAPLRHQWPDVIVEETFVAGDPARELAAQGRDAALVVVGSRGLGGFRGLLLGSTSRDLLQAVPAPVAVVRYGVRSG